MCQGFPGGSAVKNLPEVQETWVRFLGWEDPLEREWLPTPVFLPGESHGLRSLADYSPQGHKVSDMTEVTEHAHTEHSIQKPESVLIFFSHNPIQSTVNFNWLYSANCLDSLFSPSFWFLVIAFIDYVDISWWSLWFHICSSIIHFHITGKSNHLPEHKPSVAFYFICNKSNLLGSLVASVALPDLSLLISPNLGCTTPSLHQSHSFSNTPKSFLLQDVHMLLLLFFSLHCWLMWLVYWKSA